MISCDRPMITHGERAAFPVPLPALSSVEIRRVIPIAGRRDPRPPHRGGGAGARRAPAGRPPALPRVRPSLSDSRGARGRLPRPLSPRTASSRCRGATSARSSATRSRRSRSSTRCRAPTRCPSGCSAATCTARTARTGSRRSRSAIRRRSARRGTSGRRSSRPWRSRAARRRSSRPTTSRSSPRSGPSRSSARRRRAACERRYVSNGNGTPEVLDYIRPWVDFYKVDLKSMDDKHYRAARRRAAERARHDRRHSRAGRLARGPHAGDPGLQRLGGGAAPGGAVHRLGLAGHPVARDGLPSRLQDDRPRHDAGPRRSCGRARSARPRACATSTPATSRARWGSGRTRVVRAAATRSSSARASGCSRTGSSGEPVPLRHLDPGALGRVPARGRRARTGSRCPSSDPRPIL